MKKNFIFGVYKGFDHMLYSDWNMAKSYVKDGWGLEIFPDKEKAYSFFVKYYKKEGQEEILRLKSLIDKKENRKENKKEKARIKKEKRNKEIEERNQKVQVEIKKVEKIISSTKELPEDFDFMGFDHVIYADGSCLKNPKGAGGYCGIVFDRDRRIKRFVAGGTKSTTNNRMEISACLESLKTIPKGKRVLIFSDSQYVVNTFEKKWIFSWMRKKWKTSTNQPVLNKDLWKEMLLAINDKKVIFQWIKGHNGNRYNEQCDKIAREQAIKYKCS